MRLFEKYVSGDYQSYEDFKNHFKIETPERFNFAYDVLDTLAGQSRTSVLFMSA